MINKNHAGGEATINAIKEICKKDIKDVLELGGGTGLLTRTVLENSNANIDVYEHLTYFQKQVSQNSRVKLIGGYDKLPPKREYDLIIIDGGKSEKEGAFRRFIASALASLDKIEYIIIEGQRKSQRYWVVETIWREYTYTPKTIGGKKGYCVLACKKEKSFLKKFINHLYYRKKIY